MGALDAGGIVDGGGQLAVAHPQDAALFPSLHTTCTNKFKLNSEPYLSIIHVFRIRFLIRMFFVSWIGICMTYADPDPLN